METSPHCHTITVVPTENVVQISVGTYNNLHTMDSKEQVWQDRCPYNDPASNNMHCLNHGRIGVASHVEINPYKLL